MSPESNHPTGPGTNPWTTETADRFASLVLLYLDQLLSEAEASELNGLLLEHPQARDLLTLLTIERFVLRDVLQARDTSENDRGTLLDELAEMEAQAVTAAPVDITEQLMANQASSVHAAPSSPQRDRLPTVIVIPRPVVWTGIAATVLLAISLIWPWIIQGKNAPPSAATPPGSPIEAVSTAGTITKTYADEPGTDLGVAVGQDIRIGERVVIRSGLIELVNPRGVRLVIQGPSSFRFNDGLRLAMDEGRLLAQVGEGGKGFTVDTPVGRVVDHGTEFGLHYEPDDRVLEASVFEGSVSIQPDSPGAEPRRLATGWGGRVDAEGRVSVGVERPTDASRLSYVRVLPENRYAEAVLELKPVAFWAFDAVSDQQEALNHFNPWVFRGRHSSGATISRIERPGAAVGFGHALSLRGRTCLDFGDVLDFEADRAFSFAFWIRIEADVPSGSVLSRMSVSEGFRGYDIYAEQDHLLFQLKHQFVGDHASDQNNALRVELGGISSQQWTHVVFAYDGSRSAAGVNAYINGQASNTRVLSDSLTGTIRADAPFRVGRRLEKLGSISPGDALSQGSYFTGAIDDLMVFRRGLSPDEVSRLYGAATQRRQELTTALRHGRAHPTDPARTGERTN
ncbi:MAG: LamG-like jellyroll fold domain-containing protein [Planctomycetota bacterium]